MHAVICCIQCRVTPVYLDHEYDVACEGITDTMFCNTRQTVTWTNEDHTILSVHVGSRGLERVTVSHAILNELFHNMVRDIRIEMGHIGVPLLQEAVFDGLKDSSASTQPREGMGSYNQIWNHTEFIKLHPNMVDRVRFLTRAHKIYRLCMAVIHICGGPAPRGTEEAVTRLLNSDTEAMRNVQLIHGTIGIEKG